MIVPELPEDIRALKEAVGRFVEVEVYPLEERIAERGSIDHDELAALRAKARQAGFAMLNMPADLGGRDCRCSGRLRSRRSPARRRTASASQSSTRAARAPRDRDAGSGRALRHADRERRLPRGVALTGPAPVRPHRSPGDGSSRRRRVGAERREVVRHERRRSGRLHRARSRRGRADALPRRSRHAGMEIRRTPSFLHDPYIDHHPEIVFGDCRVPDANRVPASGDAGAKEWILVERLFIAARCCGAALRLVDHGRLGAGARGVRLGDRRVPGHLVPAGRLAHRAARRTATVPRGARIRRARGPQGGAREGVDGEAVRLGDGGPRRRPGRAGARRSWLHAREPPPVSSGMRVDRIWEGTSEIQRSIISRGVFKRGAAPYLGWD